MPGLWFWSILAGKLTFYRINQFWSILAKKVVLVDFDWKKLDFDQNNGV